MSLCYELEKIFFFSENANAQDVRFEISCDIKLSIVFPYARQRWRSIFKKNLLTDINCSSSPTTKMIEENTLPESKANWIQWNSLYRGNKCHKILQKNHQNCQGVSIWKKRITLHSEKKEYTRTPQTKEKKIFKIIEGTVFYILFWTLFRLPCALPFNQHSVEPSKPNWWRFLAKTKTSTTTTKSRI